MSLTYVRGADLVQCCYNPWCGVGSRGVFLSHSHYSLVIHLAYYRYYSVSASLQLLSVLLSQACPVTLLPFSLKSIH